MILTIKKVISVCHDRIWKCSLGYDFNSHLLLLEAMMKDQKYEIIYDMPSMTRV